MPTFPVKLNYNLEYNAHLPQDTLDWYEHITIEPSELRIPEDVNEENKPTDMGSAGKVQLGRLLRSVTVTFTQDGHKLVFPKNAIVYVWYTKNMKPKVIYLHTNEDGLPVDVHGKVITGEGKRRCTRRKQRKHRHRRRRRHTRRGGL